MKMPNGWENVPTAAKLPCAITRGICFPLRESRPKNARGIVRPAAVVGKGLGVWRGVLRFCSLRLFRFFTSFRMTEWDAYNDRRNRSE